MADNPKENNFPPKEGKIGMEAAWEAERLTAYLALENLRIIAHTGDNTPEFYLSLGEKIDELQSMITDHCNEQILKHKRIRLIEESVERMEQEKLDDRPSNWCEAIQCLWPEEFGVYIFFCPGPAHSKFTDEGVFLRSDFIGCSATYEAKVAGEQRALRMLAEEIVKYADNFNLILFRVTIFWAGDHFFCEVIKP